MAVSTLEGEAPGAAVNTAGDVEAGLPRDKAVTNSFRTSGMTIVFKVRS